MTIVYIILGVISLLILFWIYNSLVGKKNKVEYAFSGMDVYLKKRTDLVPNLVASVKQYMTHEQEILTEVTRLRTQIIDGSKLSEEDRFKLENQLARKVAQVQLAVENYPQLKADNNVMQLQRALTEIEEQISAARRAYNGAILSYNNSVGMFPTMLLAAILGYRRKASFEISEEERQNVDVKSLFNS